MEGLITGAFVVLGLIVGSFCNVLIYRIRAGEDIVCARSRCRSCKKRVAWYDNVPLLSFVFLRGACRHCDAPISWQYPLVESAVAVVCALVGYFYASGAIASLVAAITTALGCAGLVVVFVYDARHMEIPMGVMWSVIALFAVAVVFADGPSAVTAAYITGGAPMLHALAALAAFCFFFGLSYVSDETWMGYGDAFVALAVGLLCGPVGTFVALLVAFCAGSVYGVALTVTKRATMKSAVPFGPFLIIGALLVFALTRGGVAFEAFLS